MNERMSASTSQTEPTVDQHPRFERLPDGLQLEDLDQVVDLGKQARLEYEADNSIADSLDAHYDAKVAEALRSHGFDAESDDLDARWNYQVAKDTYNIAARVKKVDWDNPPVDNPDGLPVRNQVINMLLERHYPLVDGADGNNDTAPDDADTVSPVGGRFTFTEAQRATRDAYAESDQALARAEARRFRIGMLAGKEKRNQVEQEIEPVAIAYTTQAMLFDAVQEQKYRTMYPDINDEDLAKKMASYHTAKQRLHDLRVEHEAENGYHKFGFLSKMHNKISSWYGGLSRSEKLGVAGAGVAAAGLLGLALGPLGAVGVGVMAGAKGYRSYMQSRSELYQRQPKVERIQATNEQNVKTLDALQAESRDSMNATRAARIERTDKVNKRARITTAIGGLILGGGLAVQAAEHWGDVQHFFGGGSETPHDGGQTPGATQPGPDTNPPTNQNVAPNPIAPSDTPGTADALRHGLDGGTGGGNGMHDILDPRDAFAITPGEGLYETFQEMGIPQPMWHDVMNDVGPQLQQLGDTYWDPTHAEWRISHTGQFSDKAMKIMAAAATKHGYSLAA